MKDLTLGFLFPILYRRYARQHVELGLTVFFETKERQMPGSFELLYQRLSEDSSKKVEYVTLAHNSVSLLRYYHNCVTALKRIAIAELVFLDDASDLVSCLPMRSETCVVQLWHACGAFKKWGVSTAELKFGNTLEDIRRHPFYQNLSLVTVSSPEVVWAYVEAMDLAGRESVVRPLGVSRTDVFFDEEYIVGARCHVEELFPPARGRKVVLYAPTFRGETNAAKEPNKLDIVAMKRALGDKWVLIIKHHPFVRHPTPIPEDCKDFACLAQRDIAIEELLCAADACISDYSSIVFEYSLLERPMVFFAYDLDDYNDWRGFYYSYDEFTPGPVVATTEEVADYLVNVDSRFDRMQVVAFRNKFMCACDGHATDRVLEWVKKNAGHCCLNESDEYVQLFKGSEIQ